MALTQVDQGLLGTYAQYTGFKNRIINGQMQIDQRNAGGSLTQTTSSTYSLDRWQIYGSQASKFTIQQNAGSVTPPVGFKNYAGVTSSSSYAIGSSDLFIFRTKIEGYNLADLNFGTANASVFTLSFWVRSSLTGTFGGAFQNVDGTRSYPFNYTVSSANTWEQKTITVSGDTTGTWNTTNSIGLAVVFGLGVGADYSATAGAWTNGNHYSATGATSVVGTNGATFYITGVQLEKGSTATSFDYRPYGTELALCQRYYWASSVAATQVVDMLSPINGAPVTQPIACLPTMRTTPSCSAPSVQSSGGITLNSPAVATSATASAMLISGSWSAAGGSRGYVIFNAGNLTASAEL